MQKSSTNAVFEDPAQQTAESGQLDLANDAFLDYDFDADADTTLDFDFPGSDALLENLAENDTSVLSELDRHEKRKSLDGTDVADNGGGKRRESEDKTAKKPGRKPLTSEPTSKRKAQNRAAQRAFRERKEKHLLDLETKVEDLEKASLDTKAENGMLKAQIERLQVELKEYRKRLSFGGSGSGRAYPPLPHNTYPSQSIPGLKNDEFTFDFPTFGTRAAATQVKPNVPQKFSSPGETNPLSASPFPVAQDTKSPKENTPDSRSSSLASPLTSANIAGDLGLGAMTGLFSPSIPASSTSTRGNFISNTNGMIVNDGRPLNGNNTASSGSPSSCSDSQNGNISSITTTPEPFGNSPFVKTNDPSLGTITEENQCGSGNDGEKTFCEKLNMACGNTRNPVPAIANSNGSRPLGSVPPNSTLEPHSFEWFVNQNSGQFDPVLFGDYREQDFGTFFDDAFPLPDLGSPLHNFNDVTSPNTGIEPAKPSLMEQVDAAQNADDDEVVPADDPSQIMTCNKIWDRLQHMEKFRNGEIDIDNLCDELRGKARCSETGVVIDKKDVDAIVSRAE